MFLPMLLCVLVHKQGAWAQTKRCFFTAHYWNRRPLVSTPYWNNNLRIPAKSHTLHSQTKNQRILFSAAFLQLVNDQVHFNLWNFVLLNTTNLPNKWKLWIYQCGCEGIMFSNHILTTNLNHPCTTKESRWVCFVLEDTVMPLLYIRINLTAGSL